MQLSSSVANIYQYSVWDDYRQSLVADAQIILAHVVYEALSCKSHYVPLTCSKKMTALSVFNVPLGWTSTIILLQHYDTKEHPDGTSVQYMHMYIPIVGDISNRYIHFVKLKRGTDRTVIELLDLIMKLVQVSVEMQTHPLLALPLMHFIFAVTI